MKKILLLVVCVFGAFAPIAAAPSVAQVEQFVQDQPASADPRVTAAQEAFTLASMNYATNKMMDQLTQNEKEIDRIFEAADLSDSLQKSAQTVIPADAFANISTEEEFNAKMQELMTADPQLEEKLLHAYLQNKYIKQLIPLFWANQDQYTENAVDKQSFNELVVSFTIMTNALMQQLQQAAQ